MAQDHELGRKKKESEMSKKDPAHGPPLQARVAAANGTVSQLANMLKQTDPGAHGMNGGKQNEQNGGQAK